jgi:hypothetical protein
MLKKQTYDVKFEVIMRRFVDNSNDIYETEIIWEEKE